MTHEPKARRAEMRDGRLQPLPSVALAAVLLLAASLPAAAQSLTDVLATT